MGISFKANTKDFVSVLGKTANKLQIAGANTVNQVTAEMREDYNKRLQKNTEVRTKFTINASRTLKSNPIRSSGEPRQLNKINSKLVVKNMKGNKEHYLAKLENGTTQKGSKLTMGKVPVPLNAGRTTGNYNRSIAGGNRLLKGETQILRAGNRSFGITGDTRKNGRPWASSGQRFAALYRYKSGKVKNGNFQGDLKKPFFFIDNSDKMGIFKFKGRRLRKIRKLEKETVRFKPEPHFGNTVKAVKNSDVQEKFIINAKKALMNK